jgi:hypothetical protein
MKSVETGIQHEPLSKQPLPISQFEMRLAEELDERIEFADWGGSVGVTIYKF